MQLLHHSVAARQETQVWVARRHLFSYLTYPSLAADHPSVLSTLPSSSPFLLVILTEEVKESPSQIADPNKRLSLVIFPAD